MAAIYRAAGLAGCLTLSPETTLMAGTSNDFELSDELSKLLTSNGWKESTDLAGSFRRSHQIDGYLWTEELNLASKRRPSYVQNLTYKPYDLSRSLGETAQRCAHLMGELFEAQVPFRRTGLGKMRAYREGEVLAKAAGKLLTEGLVDDMRLFMIVHASPCTLEDLVAADSANEAFVHIKIMRQARQKSPTLFRTKLSLDSGISIRTAFGLLREAIGTKSSQLD